MGSAALPCLWTQHSFCQEARGKRAALELEVSSEDRAVEHRRSILRQARSPCSRWENDERKVGTLHSPYPSDGEEEKEPAFISGKTAPLSSTLDSLSLLYPLD